MALDCSPLQAGVPGACRSICTASPGARRNPFHAERARAHAGSKAAALQHRCIPPLRGCAGKEATFRLVPSPQRAGRCHRSLLGHWRRDKGWRWSFMYSGHGPCPGVGDKAVHAWRQSNPCPAMLPGLTHSSVNIEDGCFGVWLLVYEKV